MAQLQSNVVAFTRVQFALLTACLLLRSSSSHSSETTDGAATRTKGWFQEHVTTCAPGCTDNGNCNGETGQCDCPFGLTGPTCADRLLPACHSSLAPSTLPHYGINYPKNCQCYRQLARLGCSDEVAAAVAEGWPADQRPARCVFAMLREWRYPCYTYEGVPAEQQLSDPPQPHDPRVSWSLVVHMVGHDTILNRTQMDPRDVDRLPPLERPKPRTDPQQQQQQQPQQLEAAHPDAIIPLRGDPNSHWLPLGLCPGRCSERGWCVVRAKAGSKPECSCHGFWQGAACEAASPAPSTCYRNCSGVGRCLEGWCHCPPGRWGLGCTRDKAYSSTAGWRPNPVSLRIYVYDLPTHVAARVASSDWPPDVDPIYGAELAFTEALLGDWSVRTQNPWEANMFFVPGWGMWYGGPAESHAPHLACLALWLAGHSPFWNATQGRNHFWFASGDRGGCDVYAPGRTLDIQRPIMLTHFGQAGRTPYRLVPPHRNEPGAAPACGTDGGPAPNPLRPRPDSFVWAPSLVASFGGLRAAAAAALRTNYTQHDLAMVEEPCYRPEKDILAPTAADELTTHVARLATYNYTHMGDPGTGAGPAELPAWAWADQGGDAFGDGLVAAPRAGLPPRNITLFFAGSLRPQQYYSQGVRNAVAAMFGPGGRYDAQGPGARADVFLPKPGVWVNTLDLMRRSKFCLVLTGHGWAIRLTHALMCGCVPVIIQEATYQPLWDVVPYDAFSVRLARTDVPLLLEVLDALPPHQLERLQRGVAHWHRAFLWQLPGMSPPGVGLAYNMTLLALRRRLISLSSDNY